jgi:cell division septation protein DedD
MNKFLIGLLLGVLIAGGLAFYLNRAPSQFISKFGSEKGEEEPAVSSSAPLILAPGTKLKEYASPVTSKISSEVNSSSPKYDFYDILQGKKDLSQAISDREYKKVYYVQAGVFSDSNLANDMQARLALLGIEAKIRSNSESAIILNQVIIGPFDNKDEAQNMLNRLTQESINADIIKERIKQEEM